MNAEAWIVSFESECFRLDVDRARFWEVLRLFLEDAAEKWFETTQLSSPSTSWEFWRSSFLDNFTQCGLDLARQAFAYRYVSGTLSDNVQTKHNLLISFNSVMDEKTRIALIALGLPFFLQNRINLSDINSLGALTSLINSFSTPQARSIAGSSPRSPPKSAPLYSAAFSSLKTKTPSAFSSIKPRKPCPYCVRKGFERYHSELNCRTKIFDSQRNNSKSPNSDVLKTFCQNVERKVINNLKLQELINSEADYLSRNPVLDSSPNHISPEPILPSFDFLSLDDIRSSQSTIVKLDSDIVKSGVIFRKIFNKTCIVIDKNFGEKLTKLVHLRFGHIGPKHVIRIIRKYFYFPGMTAFIRKFCVNCSVCIRKNNHCRSRCSFFGPASSPFLNDYIV